MGEKWKQGQILFSWAPKSLWMLTAAMKLKDTCSLEEKAVINLDSILKSRYPFASKGPYSQTYGFPVVMCRCESWTIKKAEHGRIDAFELWCWRRLLRVPWTARRSNQSILKEINPEYIHWKDWCWSFSTLAMVQRGGSLEKTPMLGTVEGSRRRGWQDEMVGWHHWLNRHEFEQNPTEGKDRKAWCAKVHGVRKSQTRLSH